MRRKAPKAKPSAGATWYDAGPTHSRTRTLTAQEEALWQSVTADATPRPGRKRLRPTAPPEDPSKAVKEPKQANRHIKKIGLGVPATPAPPPVPSLAPLDRRTSKKLVRGQLTPDAHLDLHGMTRRSAEPALLRFVADARAQGLKLVLVITGKGAPGHLLHGRDFHPDAAASSVLRNFVPELLRELQFRTHVAGFQPAHPKHGGGGAFYLWLRRQR